MDGLADRLTDERTDWQTDGEMNGWIKEQGGKQVFYKGKASGFIRGGIEPVN